MSAPSRRTFLKLTGVGGAGILAEMTAGDQLRAQEPARRAVSTVDTPVLTIAYEDTGDPRGFPVILLHGFPDDPRAFDEVVPPLTKAGYRALVPYLRGYGPTKFRDSAAPRMAEQAAIGQDVIDFADALRLPRVALAGYDWGGRAAAIAAALHPDRVHATVLIGGYTVQNTVAPQPPGTPAGEHRLWYQDHFNTERGRAGLMANRHAISAATSGSSGRPVGVSPTRPTTTRPNPSTTRTSWTSSSTGTAIALETPRARRDSRRSKHGSRPGQRFWRPRSRSTAARTASHLRRSSRRPPSVLRSIRLIARRVVPGVGHFMPRERPDAVSSALLELLSSTA